MSANEENGLEGKWVTSNMAKYWQLGDAGKKQHLLCKLTIHEPKCLGPSVSGFGKFKAWNVYMYI